MKILSDNFPYHYGTCDGDCWLGAPVHFTGTLHCQHFSISTLNNSGFFPHSMSLLHSVEGRNYNAASSFQSILSIQRLMAALRNSMVTGQVRLNSLLIMHMVIVLSWRRRPLIHCHVPLQQGKIFWWCLEPLGLTEANGYQVSIL